MKARGIVDADLAAALRDPYVGSPAHVLAQFREVFPEAEARRRTLEWFRERRNERKNDGARKGGGK